jgi:hypothetical protein
LNLVRHHVWIVIDCGNTEVPVVSATMGYGITPYTCNLPLLKSLLDPEDDTITTMTRERKQQLQTQCIEGLENRLSNSGLATPDDIRAAVSELFTGAATNRDHGFIYWYAIEYVMQTYPGLSSYLDNSAWYPAPADVFFNSDCVGLFNIDYLPGKTVAGPDDFPTVFVIRNDDLDDFATEISSLQENMDDEQVGEVQAWIRQAKQSERSLVLFYY